MLKLLKNTSHLTKNGRPDKDVSVTFEELKKLVDSIEIIHKSSGSVKKVNIRELEIRKWAFRSVVSIQDIDKDQIIQRINDMVEKTWNRYSLKKNE